VQNFAKPPLGPPEEIFVACTFVLLRLPHSFYRSTSLPRHDAHVYCEVPEKAFLAFCIVEELSTFDRSPLASRRGCAVYIHDTSYDEGLDLSPACARAQLKF
jgi:hypothetical protein